MIEQSEHPVERELKQIEGKTIVEAKVTNWDDENLAVAYRDPTGILLKYSDGTESYVYVNTFIHHDAALDLLHYPKI